MRENRENKMRKLLMPTIGDMGPSDTQLRDAFRGLLPTPAANPPQKNPAQKPSHSLPPLFRSSTPPAFGGSPSANAISSLRARSLPPGLIALIHGIVSDLESRPNCVMSLNPSRREGICNHLNHLASGAGRPNLTAWLQPGRTSNESQALFSYFEEVALMAISQALLLKRWSDRGLRPFRSEHLGKLNFELSTALCPHVPLHREGFHLTRPNLYSWYSPPAALQEELFRTLESIDLREESPAFLLELCTDGRRFSPEWPELLGYDSRFYQEASNELLRWSAIARTSAAKRKTAFTPTLRLGQITHSNPNFIQWIGCEENTFSLLISEMVDLWWGPKAPPIWANSTSLDAHPKEQLSLVAPAIKPGVLSMLSDMEACDFGWIAEERTLKASRWKPLLDSLPFFKKLRAVGTHLGTLQACVAITKIRPGGRLLWIREEPLTNEEGSDALSFLLGRAKLLTEIDLSHIEHSLPTRRPLFPRFIYVFERELQHETRLAHRPVRWLGQGAIKSHVEIPLFLSDVLATVPGTIDLFSGAPSLPQRANWKLSSQVSPLPQKEWMNRWPDPSCAQSLSVLEEMSRGTMPLANLATVRPLNRALVRAYSPSESFGAGGGSHDSTSKALDPRQPALFVEALPAAPEGSRMAEPRRLQARSFAELIPGLEHSGFAVLLRDESWLEPVRAYLESSGVGKWLEHHAERRGDRWILSESLMKMIPIPERLATAITRESASPELRDFALTVSKSPEVLTSATSLPPEVRYISASMAMHEIEIHLSKVRPFLVRNEMGETRIEWTKLLGLLRASDSLPLTQHPFVRTVGNIPTNVPLTKVDRLKAPQNGLLLMTESGSLLKVVFDHRMLAEMAWDQAKFHPHPTWGELVAAIRLPRSLEIAESAAHEILTSHENLERRRVALKVWLSAGLPAE